MSLLAIVFVVASVCAIGLAVQLVVLAPRQRPGWVGALSEGFVLGVVLVGAGLWAMGGVHLQTALSAVIGVGVIAGALSAFLLWRQRQLAAAHGTAKSGEVAGPNTRSEPVSWAARFAAALLLVLFVALWMQSQSLPVLAWDAWHAWLDKSKVWFFAERFVSFKELNDWWLDESADTRFAIASRYPQALPRLWAVVQFAAGRWSDAHLAPMWCLLWLSLGGILFSALRRVGQSLSTAICWVLALLSIPMVIAHASLAGYADLWLATAVLACVVHASEALRGQRRHALLALIYLLLMPTIKLEGAVYALIIAVAFVLAMMPKGLRFGLPVAAALALGGGMLLGGVQLPIPGLGVVGWKWGQIDVPLVGQLVLTWRGVGDRVLESMFLLPNWSLLWWLLPLGLWATRRAWSEARYHFAVFALGAAAAFHFLLFCFTDAAAYAESLTSLNRLWLHVVPCWVWLFGAHLSAPAQAYGRASRSDLRPAEVGTAG